MRIDLILLLLIFGSCKAVAQLSIQAKQIESFCKLIDKDSSLKKKVFEQEEFMDHVTDNGGSLTFYYKKGIVYRITEWIGLSGYVVIMDYYFQSGKLVYVRDEEFTYERHPVTGDLTGKFSQDDRFLGKYFFRNNKLFDQVSLGHNRFEDDEHNDAEKEFTTSAKKHLSLFYKK
ncbi:hypothetical protein [Lacibacter sp. H407]|uniref:hypothetical protein n=1 Tax=Lacibacter sp. H407 TaxID=3133423 RepID=UPI0030BF62D5